MAATSQKLKLVIGTRGSKLALTQTGWVGDRLRQANPGLEIELRTIKTIGDRKSDRPFGEIGGKGIFTKELEDALLAGRIDLAVHSAKDLPAVMPEGLVLAATPPREDPRDALIARDAASIAELPAGALIGTGSLRRQAELLAVRPDLKFTLLRGNVDTRIDKVLTRGHCDATILALAGLRRVGLTEHVRCVLGLDEMLPACGQGVLAVQGRQDNEAILAAASGIHHEPTAEELRCEQLVLARLDVGCKAPVGVNAHVDGDRLTVRAVVALSDGSERITCRLASGVGGWRSLAERAIEHLRADGADEILRQCRETVE